MISSVEASSFFIESFFQRNHCEKLFKNIDKTENVIEINSSKINLLGLKRKTIEGYIKQLDPFHLEQNPEITLRLTKNFTLVIKSNDDYSIERARIGLYSLYLQKIGVAHKLIRESEGTDGAYLWFLEILPSQSNYLAKMAQKLKQDFPSFRLGFFSLLPSYQHVNIPFRTERDNFKGVSSFIGLNLSDLEKKKLNVVELDHEIGHAIMGLPDNSDHYLRGQYYTEGEYLYSNGSFDEVLQIIRSIKKEIEEHNFYKNDPDSFFSSRVDYISNMSQVLLSLSKIKLNSLATQIEKKVAKFKFMIGQNEVVYVEISNLGNSSSFSIVLPSKKFGKDKEKIVKSFPERLRKYSEWVKEVDRNFEDLITTNNQNIVKNWYNFSINMLKKVEGLDDLLPPENLLSN